MSAIVVIPARFASTRFPGKPLAPLRGIPVIQHVYERAQQSRLAAEVVVATDHNDIYSRVVSFGGRAVMTSPDHVSGTDRIAEAAGSLGHNIVVNVQGDEPLIRPEMIDDVISLLMDTPEAGMGTLARKIDDQREMIDPNVVKVVFGPDGKAFYFSRSPIPFDRDAFGGRLPAAGAPLPAGLVMYKHIGIYSYRREVLVRLARLEPSRLELIEKLEQLRALENNITIAVRETPYETLGVDTPEDLERIELCLNSSS